MTKETLDAVTAAVDAGIVQESELLDVVSRGKQRARHATLEIISKAIDDGADAAALIATAEAQVAAKE